MPSGTESSTPTSPNPTPTSTDAERNLDNINSIEPTLTRSVSKFFVEILFNYLRVYLMIQPQIIPSIIINLNSSFNVPFIFGMNTRKCLNEMRYCKNVITSCTVYST